MIVTLIEDDEAALDSLRALLEGHGYNVHCFPSAETFLDATGEDVPACVVSDVRMAGMSGLDLCRNLKRQGSLVPVILITGHGDIAMAVSAIKEGAFDFIEKPYNADHLIASIDKAIAAQREQRSRESQAAELIERIAELSPRQREVMDLVARGHSNKQIAQRLGISPRTVENYRAWVMERMGAANVAELVRKVMTVERDAARPVGDTGGRAD
jgi:two-component system, LuxR family, response regulator FixJ